MFSSAAGRVARSPSTLPPPSVCAFARPATIAAAPMSFARPSHQRRLSSSKASIPPDNSNANGSTPSGGSNTNGSNSTQQASASAGKAPARKANGRAGRKRTTPAAPTLNVPHVPPTDYLQKPEVKISSFFSLHRPISLDQVIPPVSTTSSFESIFTPRSPYTRKTTIENIQTLSSGIESLEAALAVQEKQAPADSAPLNSDEPPQITLEQLMARFVPFRPPPPPVALGQVAETQPANNTVVDVAATPSQIKKRAWSTAVVVTESTDASGKRTYSATTAPMVEIAAPAAENGQELDQFEVRQPFLDRMNQRQHANNSGRDMFAISVKRQRKLKMKKHKYKKLMKRTRLERRKLGKT